ncbi:hypothetical protein TGVAND_225540 [Toxoplasma gondii VAND]|uniref:TolA n=1 Tax=Toxoplasma gondii VAND TaxID=933077 RepID=A0A086QL21_TOXGO|nr:hypothetical protein TGVAND_225540 [Toxoplasma gondii VAND]
MDTDLLVDLDRDNLLESICTEDILAGLNEDESKPDKGGNEEKLQDDSEKSAGGKVKVEDTEGDKSSRGSVDCAHLDKMTGLNKFRDLEKRREEERKQHQMELEAEKAKKPYSGKKWGITTPAGPVRPQEAAGSVVAEAVRSNKTKISAREEIEQQTRKALEKQGLLTHPVSPRPSCGEVPAVSVTSPIEQNSDDAGAASQVAVAGAASVEASGEGKHEDGAAHCSTTQSTGSQHSEHDEHEDAKDDKGAQEDGHNATDAHEVGQDDHGGQEVATGDTNANGEAGVTVVAATEVLDNAGSAEQSQVSVSGAGKKTELQKIKHKMLGLFACYNKKGVKEPIRPEESAVTVEAVTIEAVSAAGPGGNALPGSGTASTDQKEQSSDENMKCDVEQGKPEETQNAAEAEKLDSGKESPVTAGKPSQPMVDEAAKPAAEDAAKQTVEEASKQTVEEASKQTVEEASKQTVEEAAKQAVEEAAKQTASEVTKPTEEANTS